mmetsp:Transcript_27599/g.38923  ORF Transcript_27599/g.38923 Transcript_27599/m.38923 type:complete len:89 (+) Transcript_27599:52-318(+)
MEISWEEIQQDLNSLDSLKTYFPSSKSPYDIDTQASNETAEKKDLEYSDIATIYQNYSLEDISREIATLSLQDEEKRQYLFDTITKKF